MQVPVLVSIVHVHVVYEYMQVPVLVSIVHVHVIIHACTSTCLYCTSQRLSRTTLTNSLS